MISTSHKTNISDTIHPCETFSPSESIPDCDVELRQMIPEDKSHLQDAIQCLPIEILAHIFTFCLHPPLNSNINSDSREIRRGAVDFRHPVPFHLGSICRHWREVAWSTPGLWNTLRLHVSGSTTYNLKRNRLVDGWLHRSGQLPLHISVFYSIRESDPSLKSGDSSGWDSITSVLETLIHYSNRWKYLDACLPRFYIPLLLSGTRSAHNLETLTIDTIYRPEPSGLRRPAEAATSNKASPRCVYLWVQGIPDIEVLCWSRVLHLKLGKIRPRLLLHILRLTSELESLKLTFCEVETITTYDPVTVMSLHTLRLYWTSSSFLRYICCPNLKILLYQSDGNSFSNIPSFLTRSSCSLTVLTVIAQNNGDMRPDDLKTLFSVTPSLTQLNLRCDPGASFVSKEFFKIFGSPVSPILHENGKEQNALINLPHLRELNLIHCTQDFHWPPIQSLIACRPLSRIVVQVDYKAPYVTQASFIRPVIDFENLTEILRAQDGGIDISITDRYSNDLILGSRKFYGLFGE